MEDLLTNYILHPLLMQSENCCYLLIKNPGYDIIKTNTTFNKIFPGSESVSAVFTNSFTKNDQQKWIKAFYQIVNNTSSVATLSSTFKRGTGHLTIDWSINAVTDNGIDVAGFEILGVIKAQENNEFLIKAQEESNKILDSSLDMICKVNATGHFEKVSAACREILGYEPNELIGKNYLDIIYEEDKKLSENVTAEIAKGHEVKNLENRFYKKDGSVIHLTWSSRWDKRDKMFYSVARDSTEKKEREAALKASEEKYRVLFYEHPLPTWIYDEQTLEFLEVNEAAVKAYGYSREEFLSMSLDKILTESDFKKYSKSQLQGEPLPSVDGLWMHRKKNNEEFYAEITSGPIRYQNREAKIVLSFDRTMHTLAERELLKSNEKYKFLSEATWEAIWDWNLETDIIDWNDVAKKMFEVEDKSVLNQWGWWLEHLHPEDRERVHLKLKTHIDNGMVHWEDEYRFRTGKDRYIYIHDRGYTLFDGNKKPVRMIGAMQDLTQRKAHEDMLQDLNNSLEKRAKELIESNEELERFAYVASHDLQEPLRMVTSFLQLLEKRYNDKLDKKAKEYIAYAVDGAERMKKLILDLLEYSRVNTSSIEREQVNLNDILQELKLTYARILEETGGSLTMNKMPVIKANRTQITQLFQNLVSNAIKYKSDEPPVIQISAEEEHNYFKFTITDNGIGIDPKFYNKIFILFQRLHNREQYSGTGIGLAICKKIVDKHNGKIWVASSPGKGSTFYFTISKS